MDAQQILEQLTDLYDFQTVLNMQKEDAIPADVKQVLADIDAEFAPKLEAVRKQIADYEAAAKQAVLEAGETVKGGALQAVYAKGRVSWDGKKLDGMMALVPGLSAARKEGEPSVSIRKVG